MAERDSINPLPRTGCAPVDLHMHSGYSTAAKDTFMLRQLARDGAGLGTSSSIADKGPVERMVEEAARKGLGAISLTDHWTAESVAPARRKAEECGVEYVNGIEMGALLELDGCGCEVHLLGYFYDVEAPGLQRLCREAKETCALGALAFLEGLAHCGIPLSREEVDSEYPGGFSSWAIRRMLVSRGHARDKFEASQLQQRAVASALERGARYGILKEPRPLHPEDIIPVLHKAGATVFMAHPFWITKPQNGGFPEEAVWQQIEAMLALGVDGLEAYYPTPEKAQGEQLLEFCRARQIPASGGSDSHNPAALSRAPSIPGEALASIKRHRGGLKPWT